MTNQSENFMQEADALDLRSPLGGLESMIVQLGHARSASDQEALIAALKSAAEHLRSVADAMVDPQQRKATEVPLTEALRFFSVAARARCDAVGISYRHEIGDGCQDLVIADGMVLRQMMESLLDNAIRHSGSRDVVVRIKAASGKHGRDLVDVAVLDSGKGLGAPCNTTGIGLALVRRLAAEMGGTCGVANRTDGRGVCAFFSLPAERRKQDVQADNSCVLPAILAVDGDAKNRRLVGTILEHLGYDVACAATVEEAHALLQDRVFSAVFVSANADELTAVRPLAQLVPEIPVVGMISDLDAAKRDCHTSGLRAAVEKPCTVHDLRQVLVAIGLRDPMLRQVSAA